MLVLSCQPAGAHPASAARRPLLPQWLALHDNFGLPVHVFRCGGIYGEVAAGWW